MNTSYSLGIDIGGTKVAFALVDNHGQVSQSSQLATDVQGETSQFLDLIAQEIQRYLKVEPQIQGIGIGCPGYIDSVEGIVLNAVNLKWLNMPLRRELSSRLSGTLPIFVQNDCTAAALGEMVFGATVNSQDFLHISIGTGLGGSAIVNGKQLIGANNYGFEIGHIVRKPQGRLCNCGLYGCTEMYVSGRGVLTALAEHLSAFPNTVLNASSTTTEILQAARDHDALACHIMEESADSLAELLTYGIVLLNPSQVVIGGGFGLAALDFYIDGMLERFSHRMLPTSYQNLKLVASSISSSAVGSASLVWHGMS